MRFGLDALVSRPLTVSMTMKFPPCVNACRGRYLLLFIKPQSRVMQSSVDSTITIDSPALSLAIIVMRATSSNAIGLMRY